MYVTIFLSHDRPEGALPDAAMVSIVAEVKDDVTPGGMLEQTLRPAAHALIERLGLYRLHQVM